MAEYTYDARTGMYVLRDGRKLTKQEFVDYNAAKFGGTPKTKTTPATTPGIDNIPKEFGIGPDAMDLSLIPKAAGIVKEKVKGVVKGGIEAGKAVPGIVYRGGAKGLFETPTLTKKKQLVSHTTPGSLGGIEEAPTPTPSVSGGGKPKVAAGIEKLLPQMSHDIPSASIEEQPSLSLLNIPKATTPTPEPSLWEKAKSIPGKAWEGTKGIASGIGKWAEDPKIAMALMAAGLQTLAAEPRRVPYSDAEMLGKAGLAGIGAFDTEVAKEAAGMEMARKAGIEERETKVKETEAITRAAETKRVADELIAKMEREKELHPLEKQKIKAEINKSAKEGKIPPLSVFMVDEYDPQTGYRIGEKFDRKLYNEFAKQNKWQMISETPGGGGAGPVTFKK